MDQSVKNISKNLKKPIVLVGMMGSGKTTLGRRIAAALDLHFVDSDAVIEEICAKPIFKIFEEEGEPFFRQKEAEAIANTLLNNELCVLSCGGGAVMNSKTLDMMIKKAHVIWIKVSLPTLLRRLENDKNRPLLAKGDLKNNLERLLAEREKYYKNAHFVVSNDLDDPAVALGQIYKNLILK